MRLYCGNKFAVSIAHNLVQYDQTKHIDIGKYFIKEKQDSGLIYTHYVSTDHQLAYILDMVQYDQTKHTDIDKYFIKEKQYSGLIYTP